MTEAARFIQPVANLSGCIAGGGVVRRGGDQAADTVAELAEAGGAVGIRVQVAARYGRPIRA